MGDDGYQVKADLPGMKKEDITVNLNDKTNVLTISAEKKDEINQDTDTYKRRERYFVCVQIYQAAKDFQPSSYSMRIRGWSLVLTGPQTSSGREQERKRKLTHQDY